MKALLNAPCEAAAAKLWQISEQMTGVTFPTAAGHVDDDDNGEAATAINFEDRFK
ncbi:hypothetical protein [Rhizobium halophytocola]|uniref:Uncharacterized protein n=1 Tax=Rhizobium halophytocola TaxID=735519 RepID=A0ABS4E4M4_9HYPH|nr:hypothetical protein [Rhizobium halophytocola]MBP1852863.1 hypothetical protein [Rhizobium halophytocola]